jgi:hypothetical protein
VAALAFISPIGAQEAAAPGGHEIEALRREIQDLRVQVQALREQIASLSAPGGTAAAATPAATAGPEAPPYPAAAAAGTAPHARSQGLLNPAISAVFQTIGNTSLSHENDANGFDLSEAEVAFQSVVDPYAKVDLFLSFPAGETPEVEEGFVTTLALPASLQLKAGRFKSAFGKWNTLHTHAFFSVERPNALVNLFGDESLTSDGLSLSWLIPNPWGLYLDSITEVGTALEGVSFNGSRRNLTYLEHLSGFFNTSQNSTFEVGLTASRGRTGPSASLLAATSGLGLIPHDELDSAVQGIDLTYKWKPLQLNVYRSFLWQTEVLRSRRHIDTLTPSLTLTPDTLSSLGGYSYVEWQIVKRWRIGVRYDLSGLPYDERARESAGSGVVRFQPSEFQELRLQFKHTRRNEEAALVLDADRDDNQIFFEWIPVIGAHGAHKY